MTIFFVLVAVITACVNWWSRVTDNSRVETITKPAATIAIAAASLTASKADGPTIAYGAMAFLFCLIGDVALLAAIDKFIVGLAAFLIAHVAFTAMCLRIGNSHRGRALLAALLMGVAAATIGRHILAGARREAPTLLGPVVAYLAVIAVMTIAAWGTGLRAATFGASLFVFSDSVLGWRRFVGDERWMGVTVMVTYHLGIAGLGLALAQAK